MQLDIRCVPYLGFRADDRNRLVTNLQDEVTLFECPLAVSTCEGKALGRQLEGNGLRLTRLQCYLGEVAQTLVVRNDTGDEVARVEQHSLLTGTTARILHVNTDGEDIISSKRCLVDFQVGIFISGITDAIDEVPL